MKRKRKIQSEIKGEIVSLISTPPRCPTDPRWALPSRALIGGAPSPLYGWWAPCHTAPYKQRWGPGGTRYEVSLRRRSPPTTQTLDRSRGGAVSGGRLHRRRRRRHRHVAPVRLRRPRPKPVATRRSSGPPPTRRRLCIDTDEHDGVRTSPCSVDDSRRYARTPPLSPGALLSHPGALSSHSGPLLFHPGSQNVYAHE